MHKFTYEINEVQDQVEIEIQLCMLSGSLFHSATPRIVVIVSRLVLVWSQGRWVWCIPHYVTQEDR